MSSSPDRAPAGAATPEPPPELWGSIEFDPSIYFYTWTTVAGTDDPVVFRERPSEAVGWKPALIGVSPVRLAESEARAERAEAEVERLTARNAALVPGLARMNDDIGQTLGKALGYPWFKDDQAIFPGATEAEGVCIGDHVAESIADEAAAKIGKLRAEIERLTKLNDDKFRHIQAYCKAADDDRVEVKRLTAERDNLVDCLILRRRDHYEWAEVCVTGNSHLSLATNTTTTRDEAREQVRRWAAGMTPDEIEDEAAVG